MKKQSKTKNIKTNFYTKHKDFIQFFGVIITIIAVLTALGIFLSDRYQANYEKKTSYLTQLSYAIFETQENQLTNSFFGEDNSIIYSGNAIAFFSNCNQFRE